MITVWPVELSTTTGLCTVQWPSQTATRNWADGRCWIPLSQAKPISLALPNGMAMAVTALAPLFRDPLCTSASSLGRGTGLANAFRAAVSPLNTSTSTVLVPTRVVPYWWNFHVDQGCGTAGRPAGADGSAIHNGYWPRPAQFPCWAKPRKVYTIGVCPVDLCTSAHQFRAYSATRAGLRPSDVSRSSASRSPAVRPCGRTASRKARDSAAAPLDGWAKW